MAAGRGASVRGELVVVAEVDHRAHAVRLERRPAVRAEAVERVGADDRAAADLAAVAGAQAAEVAHVGAAVPVQMSVLATGSGDRQRPEEI